MSQKLKVSALSGVFLLAVFASSLIFLHSLSRASDKNFWLDEVYEFYEPLNRNVLEFWTKGTFGTPSASPLYFSIEHVYVRDVLKTEKLNSKGFDWRVSLRFVSALGLSIGALLSSVLLLGFNNILAIGFPVFLGTYNFALYYGAESRIYGPWLGFTLALYASALRFIFAKRFWPWGLIFVALCLINTLLAISSPIIVGALALAVGLCQSAKRVVFGTLALGLALSGIAFLIYKTGETHWFAAQVIKSTNLHLLSTEALRMFEGPKHFFELLFEIGFLLISGKYAHSLKHKLLYKWVSVIAISQIFAMAITYILQTGTGYFFAPRHAIFGVAIQAMVAATLVVLAVEIFEVLLSHAPKNYRSPRFRLGGTCIILIISYLNWLQWRVWTIPESIQKISSSYLTYCHGPVSVPKDLEAKSVDLSKGVPVEQFNILNIKRHHADCGPSKTDLGQFDFSPSWIYSDDI